MSEYAGPPVVVGVDGSRPALDAARWAAATAVRLGAPLLLAHTYPDGATESFETSLGGWVAGPAPAGSAANANTWVRTDASGFKVGNSVTTPQTVILGFGLEGVTSAAKRTALMGAVKGHLLQ